MVTRNLEKARDAFKNKSKEGLIQAHKRNDEPHNDHTMTKENILKA